MTLNPLNWLDALATTTGLVMRKCRSFRAIPLEILPPGSYTVQIESVNITINEDGVHYLSNVRVNLVDVKKKENTDAQNR